MQAQVIVAIRTACREELPHIFERFYRGEKAANAARQRFGLGFPLPTERACS
jgi:signal transduction histidine kinase